jgi:hypothetical protein
MASQLTKTCIVAKRLMSDSARYISPVSQLGTFLSFLLKKDEYNSDELDLYLPFSFVLITGQIAHKVSPFEQRLLVWSGQFKKTSEVPNLVS